MSATDGTRPTMKDVARRAGVSTSTVSYVINESGSVAPERRARVLEAVRDLGYQPNESARSLKRGRVATIGLVVPELTNPFFALVAEGVQDVAMDRGVLVVLCSTDASEQGESHYVKLLRSQRVDGVVYLSGTGFSPRSLAGLAASEAVVFVDERVAGLEAPFVGADSRRGAREVAAHVLGHGHRRIAIVGGPPALWTSEQRLAGYREAIAAAGEDPDAVVVHEGDYRQESGWRAADDALGVPAARRPTALICANDEMAVGALRRCRELSLDVPGDVSIVGFDDQPLAALLTPALTSVSQPAREMGRRAARALLAVVGGERPAAQELLPAEVRLRDSVGPVA